MERFKNKQVSYGYMEEKIGQDRGIKKDSLMKRILLAGGETANAIKLSYVMGGALGVVGRATGEVWVPAIPPAVDLINGALPTPGRLICYTAYGAGVATAYADKIYSIISPSIS